MLLIVFTKQTPALGRTAQTVDLSQRGFGRRGEQSPQPGSQQQHRTTGQPGDKHIRRQQADKKEQEGGDDQNGFPNAVRAAQGILFMRLLANVQQLDLLSLFATDGGLRRTCALKRKTRGFLKVLIQRVAVQ